MARVRHLKPALFPLQKKTRVFTRVTAILLLLCMSFTCGCAAMDAKLKKDEAAGGWMAVAGDVLKTAGAAVTPGNPILGSILAGVGVVGGAVGVQQHSKAKKLKAPWDGKTDRRAKSRQVWDENRRQYFRSNGATPQPAAQTTTTAA